MNIAIIAQGLAILLWVIALGMVALVVTRAYNSRPLKGGIRIILLLVVVAVVFSLAAAGLVFIEPQEAGVVISAIAPGGYRQDALLPGLHWIVPLAEYVVIYPTSKQTYTMSIAASEGDVYGDDSIAARTRDGQEIYVDASVIFRIDPTKVVNVHKEWQNRYTNDLVRAQARGVIRDAVSQYGVEEVVSSKRAEMIDRVTTNMRTKLEENGLLLDDFVLRNIAFSTEYAASVEQKQIAEQQAQQSKFVIEQKKNEAQQAREVALGLADAAVTKAEGEAKARLIQANAEAEALQMLIDVIGGHPDIISYLYVNKIASNIQVMLLPSNSPFLYNLPELQNSTVVTPTEVVPTPVPTATP
jgi:regulator of protease activity HflC (stomatin/prohibitin superfamily)